MHLKAEKDVTIGACVAGPLENIDEVRFAIGDLLQIGEVKSVDENKQTRDTSQPMYHGRTKTLNN